MIPHTFRAESASSPRAGEKGKTRPEELGLGRQVKKPCELAGPPPGVDPFFLCNICPGLCRVVRRGSGRINKIVYVRPALLVAARRGEGFNNFLATFYTCWIWDVDCCEAGRRCDGILCARGVRESEPFFFPKNLWDDFFRFRL